MIFFAIIACALILILFLYLKQDANRKEIKVLKRQLSSVNIQEKHHEEASKILINELNKLLLQQVIPGEGPDLRFKQAVIESFETAANEVVSGRASMQEGIKRYLGNYTDISHEEFDAFILRCEADVRQAWQKNSLMGLISFCQKMS